MEEKRWRMRHRTTVAASEREKLQAYVKAAEDAIHGCDDVLNGSIPWEERVAMGTALSILKLLKKCKSKAELLNSSTGSTLKIEMSETQMELCGKCEAEIDFSRRVDFTLKDGTRVCEPCFVKETRRPSQPHQDWTN